MTETNSWLLLVIAAAVAAALWNISRTLDRIWDRYETLTHTEAEAAEKEILDDF